jgi:hypothetical protein
MDPNTDDVTIIPTSGTAMEATSAAFFPNIEQWLSYSVAMFPSPAQDSVLQSIVDFMQHRPHTAETLPSVVISEPVFPQIIVDGKVFQESRVAKVSSADSAIQVVRARGQPLRIDPNSPVARTAAPAAHALRQEEDSFEEPLKKFARNDEFHGNLPPGWRVEVVMRSKGKFRGKKADKYWYHPNGTRFKSFAAVQEYLSTHQDEMNTIEEKTPIVYRVSSRTRRDVPEHQSKSKKRNAEAADLDQVNVNNLPPGQQPLLNAVGVPEQNPNSLQKRIRSSSLASDIVPGMQSFPVLLPPTLPRAIVSISDSRYRVSGENQGYLEFKTTYSDGSVSWETATAFYDMTTATLHPVYLDFLNRSAESDAAKFTGH